MVTKDSERATEIEKGEYMKRRKKRQSTNTQENTNITRKVWIVERKIIGAENPLVFTKYTRFFLLAENTLLAFL